MKRRIDILLALPIFVIPLLFTKATLDPVTPVRLFALDIVLTVLFLAILIRPNHGREDFDFSILKRPLFLAYVFYLAFSAISLTNATNKIDGVFELLKISAGILLLIVLTSFISRNKSAILGLSRSVIISSLVISLIGILQYYRVAFNEIPGNFELYATMANQNLLSSFLLFSLPFIFYGVLRFSRHWLIVSSLSAMLIWYAIVLTQTRAVWLAFAVASLTVIMVTTVYLMKVKASEVSALFKHRVVLLVVMLSVASVLAFTPQLRHSDDDLSMKEQLLKNSAPISTVEERLLLWEKTLHMIWQRPITGVGLGNWKINIPHYGVEGMRSEFGNTHFQRPHNDYLWVFSETGMVGFLSYLALFIIPLFYTYRILFRSSACGNDKVFTTLMLFGIIAYMVVAGFSYPKERIAHSVYLMLTMASVVAIYHHVFPLHNTPVLRAAIKRRFWVTITIGILALSTGSTGFRLSSELALKRALEAWEVKDWHSVITYINKAESSFYNMDPMATPIAWYKGVAYFNLGSHEEALNNFEKAYRLHPYHIHVLNNLASSYELSGRHQQAIAYYKRALAISPHFEGALLNLGIVYYNLGQFEEANNVLVEYEKNSYNPQIQQLRTMLQDKMEQP